MAADEDLFNAYVNTVTNRNESFLKISTKIDGLRLIWTSSDDVFDNFLYSTETTENYTSLRKELQDLLEEFDRLAFTLNKERRITEVEVAGILQCLGDIGQNFRSVSFCAGTQNIRRAITESGPPRKTFLEWILCRKDVQQIEVASDVQLQKAAESHGVITAEPEWNILVEKSESENLELEAPATDGSSSQQDQARDDDGQIDSEIESSSPVSQVDHGSDSMEKSLGEGQFSCENMGHDEIENTSGTGSMEIVEKSLAFKEQAERTEIIVRKTSEEVVQIKHLIHGDDSLMEDRVSLNATKSILTSMYQPMCRLLEDPDPSLGELEKLLLANQLTSIVKASMDSFNTLTDFHTFLQSKVEILDGLGGNN